jgi:N-carbamoyl-L-amino-acid hydrolase
MELAVDFPRLQADLEELASIGRRPDHGIYRMALTEPHDEAVKWFKGRIEQAGLDLYVDGAANVHGRLHWDGKTPSVMTGSHIDTVPGAGHLDGALGVVAGLECLRRLRELGVETRRPLEVVSFLDEEGRFGAMPGSQAIAGKLTPEAILGAKDLDGVRFADALKERGFDPMHALRAARPAGTIDSFVELHIEQGPVLEKRGARVGVVEGISGLFKWNVCLIGVANHAGTTPMDMRQDALGGLAEIADAIPRILEENGGPKSVATIGRVALFPGAPNVVPGRCEFTLDVRDIDGEVLGRLGEAFRRAMSAIARRRSLMFEFEVLSEIEPVRCDARVMAEIETSIRETGEGIERLPSGAAHDTQQLAAITRVGMIFVQSNAGRSHSPAEWTSWEAIEAGSNALLRTLHHLAT